MNISFARLVLAVVTVVLAGVAAHPAQAQVTHLDESVSDDGSVPPSSREAARLFLPSNPGAPGELSPLSEPQLRAAGARPATAAFHEKVRTYKPIRGPLVMPESVIGPDNRTRVTNTKTFPARATVIITFNSGYLCSGWLVNRNTVVTAGHCVSDGDGTMFDKTTYEIAPGYNSSATPSAPYGTCGAKRLYTNATWKNGNMAPDDYDYGAIKLDCQVPAAVGYYGYSKTVALGNPITVQGYPGDKTFGTQWKMAGKVSVLQARRVFYPIDTYGGQSGSPVWRNVDTTCQYCGIAIHAYGTYGSPPYSTNNHGTRITTAVFNNITNWKNAP